ncbi:MAG: type II secretion system protein GspC [Spongiibacteraceae bacterium]|nr:type II secretion system protein GspC [Spongiibacteraceae bacterium]
MTAGQVAASITTMAQQFSETLRGLPAQSLQRGAYGLLSLWLLLVVVQFIGIFIPEGDNSDEVVVVGLGSKSTTALTEIDIKRLQSFDLFGQIGDQAIVVDMAPMQDDVDLNAVKTKLDLELQGIISASETTSAVAIIVHKGKQDQYHVGDKMPVGNRVVLAKVLNDHVILDNKGNFESLWLYDDSKLGSANKPAVRNASVSQPKVRDMRDNKKATRLAKDYRQRLYKNPKSLAEVLRISPAQSDGEMVGYRVSPGRDREQFTQLGFKTNDVVTAINDIALDEPSRALEVYKLMRTATEASFTVLRNGESLQLMVTLGENNE